MRLVKFTNAETNKPVYIAPGAVISVEPMQRATSIRVAGKKFPYAVKEDLDTVMNALYYKNDGGHAFGNGDKNARELPTTS